MITICEATSEHSNSAANLVIGVGMVPEQQLAPEDISTLCVVEQRRALFITLRA